MSIDVGEHANDYKQIQAKEKLSELQLRVRQLTEQVEQIIKEQNYQRVCSKFATCTVFSVLFVTRKIFQVIKRSLKYAPFARVLA